VLPGEPGQTGADSRAFVDAHHHLWDLDHHRYQWLADPGVPETERWIGDYAAIRTSYLLADLLRDASGCGLAKSVHVEALWGGEDSTDETRWLQAIADRHGFPHAIVARVDLRRPDAEAHLARHAAHPNFRGVRMAEMRGLISGTDFRRGFAAIRRLGLSYDLNIVWCDAGAALDLARSSPETPIVVDNMANPASLEWDLLLDWWIQMRSLAAAPNVAMKISGLGMADHSWTVDRIRPWVLEAIDIFGPGRCMFGTNWPVDSLYGSYRELVNAYATTVAAFTDAERSALFAETAQRVYRV